MASLRETKDRISSVRSTLKITSAMKLVASSKLRKAQKTIEALRPYEEELHSILNALGSADLPSGIEEELAGGSAAALESRPGKTVVVAMSSNTSLCGSFNGNVIRKAQSVVRDCGPDVEVWSFGRKMADAMRKEGFPSPADCNDFVAHPSFAAISDFASRLVARFNSGEVSRILLVYNHFVNASKQIAVLETYLPQSVVMAGASMDNLYIVEPSASEVVEELTPQVLNLKMYAAVLDSVAAEHAARTVAMQTATDNANDLLADLTLEYNKGRQQKITSEILDLVGGSLQ